MPAPKKVFTVKPAYEKLDESGEPVLDAEKKPVKVELGDFVFRVPTLGERREIGCRRATLLRGLDVDQVTDYIATMQTTLTYLCERSPEGWDWEALYFPSDLPKMQAVHDAYEVGLGKFRG